MSKFTEIKSRTICCAAGLVACAVVLMPPAFGQTTAQEDRGPLTAEPAILAPTLPTEPVDPSPLGTTDIQISEPTEQMLTDVRFEGVAVPIEVAEAVRPYIGQAISREMLEAMTAAMSEAYRETDVALFTILVPDQDFRNGILRVQVAEGFVQAVRTSGDIKARNAAFVEQTFQALIEREPLTKSALQRRLLLIQDTPGLSVKPEFRTGAGDGAVIFTLATEEKKSSLTVGFNNRTTSLIDQGQFSANGKVFNLIRPGDQTVLSLAASTDFTQSRYAGLSHSTPFGHSGLRASASAAIQTSNPDDAVVSGNAELYAFSLSYPVLRSQKQTASLSVAFDALNSENAAFGSVFSSERTRALRFGGAYSRVATKRSLSASGRISRGLDILNTRQGARSFDTNFLKFNLDVSAVQRVSDLFLIRANASGQWSDDTLPTNERFFIGGARYGRGFRSSLTSADRAGAVLVEPAFRPIRSGPFRQSEIYAFADYVLGDRQDAAPPVSGMFDLGSYGIGARAAYKRSRLEVEAARAYDGIPAAMSDDWIISVRWRIDVKRF